MDLKQHIRHVPDFPKAGILFYDITTLLRNAEGFAMTIDMLASPYVGKGIDVVVGIESRGFILGAAVAERIKAGLFRFASRGSCRRRRSKRATRSSTGPTRSRCTRTPSTRAAGPHRGRRAGHRRHGLGGGAAGEEAGRRSAGARVSDRAAVPERKVEAGWREGLLGAPVLRHAAAEPPLCET